MWTVLPVSGVKPDATAIDIAVTDDRLTVTLADWRELPLAWSARHSDASNEQRQRMRLIGRGQGIHWPEIDEDISVTSLLRA